MNIQVVAVGARLPAWVDENFEIYARRLPGNLSLQLVTVAAVRATRSAGVAERLKTEARRIARVLPRNARIVVLDEHGTALSSRDLAARLHDWQARADSPVLVIGGPDGLASELKAQAAERWSLSRLTLPHALVRVIVAEQLYRAWTILSGHPYHRD